VYVHVHQHVCNSIIVDMSAHIGEESRQRLKALLIILPINCRGLDALQVTKTKTHTHTRMHARTQVTKMSQCLACMCVRDVAKRTTHLGCCPSQQSQTQTQSTLPAPPHSCSHATKLGEKKLSRPPRPRHGHFLRHPAPCSHSA